MGVAFRGAVLVGSDLVLRDAAREGLHRAGLAVTEALTGEAALDACSRVDPDVVLIGLPVADADGTDLVERLRRATPAYLLLVVPAGWDVVALLDAGADDCIPKPAAPAELRARVNALLRRPRAYLPDDREPVGPGARRASTLSHGELCVDVNTRVVSVGGRELDLTRTEFDLLATMLSDPQRVWSRDLLLRSVWDTDWAPDGHLVEVHMGNLRRKLGDDARTGRYVRTVRGVGYRLAAGQPV